MFHKTIIIGAGIAGISCANKLNQYGFESIILEAQEKAGGRVKTITLGNHQIDLGPFVIHGIHNNPIAKLADKYKLTHSKIPNESIYITDQNRKTITYKECESLDAEIFAIADAACASAHKSENDLSLTEAIDQINHKKINPAYFTWKKSLFAGYFGLHPDKLSARFWDQEIILEGGHHIIHEGYQTLIDLLSHDLEIHFDTIVNEIDYSDKNNIKITTNNKVYYCENVIITLPIGILQKQSVKFTPDLPNEKTTAIQQIYSGNLEKIIFEFDEIFWPNDFSRFASIANKEIPMFFNLAYFNNSPILIGLFNRNGLKCNDEKLKELAINSLANIFSSKIPNPKNTVITHWHTNSYSFGSYSTLSTGNPAFAYDELAKTINHRLYFAGEATMKEFPASMHGAYWSGERAALEVMTKYGVLVESEIPKLEHHEKLAF